MKFKKLFFWLFGLMSTTTIAIGLASLQSSACVMHFYQPELPEELDSYRR